MRGKGTELCYRSLLQGATAGIFPEVTKLLEDNSATPIYINRDLGPEI